MWKVLSQGVHMCNMKALLLLRRKLWPRLKFLSTQTPTGPPHGTKILILWMQYTVLYKIKGFIPKIKIVWSGFPLFTCINDWNSTKFLFHNLQLHYLCEHSYEWKLKIKAMWLWVRRRQLSQNTYFLCAKFRRHGARKWDGPCTLEIHL